MLQQPADRPLSYDAVSGDVQGGDGEPVAHLRICRLTGHALLYGHSKHWPMIYASDSPLAALAGGVSASDDELEQFAISKLRSEAPADFGGPKSAIGAAPIVSASGVYVLLDEKKRLTEALKSIYTSAVDQRSGYADRHLHEPWDVTQRRAYDALVDVEPALEGQLAAPARDVQDVRERQRS